MYLHTKFHVNGCFRLRVVSCPNSPPYPPHPPHPPHLSPPPPHLIMNEDL